jgi:predicted transcriptional regulator of viral defense system
MATKMSTARSAAAWRLARKQHGTVARRQLLALAFTPAAIRQRLQTGRLHRTRQGVYAVGRAELSSKGRWMAAILACGEGAFLSHRSAAALYGIGEERAGVIELGVPRRGERHREGIRVYRRPSLPAQDLGTFAAIPVTSPARTMVDYASLVGPRTLERAVNNADKRDLIDPESLRHSLDDYAGEPGVRPLRTLLDRDTFLLSDAELELLFRPIPLKPETPCATRPTPPPA